MKLTLTLILALSMPLLANAQSSGSLRGKVAVVSLIGNVITIDTYRRKVGTSIGTNYQEVLPVSSPIFDNTVIAAAADAVYPQLAPGASVATLAVPTPDSGFDPARLVVDGGVSRSNALVAALRENGFTHLLAIAKHRGAARLQLADETVGGGYLQGIGFYIDNELATYRTDTGEMGKGFIAAYAYLRRLLINVETFEIQGDKTVTASAARSVVDNKTGFDPWGAMTAEEKVSTLQSLLREHVAAAVPLLFRQK
jgi:hypothetical protein